MQFTLNKFVILADGLSFTASIILLLRTLAFQPVCFSLFENLMVIFPLLGSKTAEYLLVFRKKTAIETVKKGL